MTPEQWAEQIAAKILLDHKERGGDGGRIMSEGAIRHLVLQALREAVQIARAEGERDGVLMAAERWQVPPGDPNYPRAIRAAVADNQARWADWCRQLFALVDRYAPISAIPDELDACREALEG